MLLARTDSLTFCTGETDMIILPEQDNPSSIKDEKKFHSVKPESLNIRHFANDGVFVLTIAQFSALFLG
jgi:hypothetical protein